jgi:hypothetical protein
VQILPSGSLPTPGGHAPLRPGSGSPLPGDSFVPSTPDPVAQVQERLAQARASLAAGRRAAGLNALVQAARSATADMATSVWREIADLVSGTAPSSEAARPSSRSGKGNPGGGKGRPAPGGGKGRPAPGGGKGRPAPGGSKGRPAPGGGKGRPRPK